MCFAFCTMGKIRGEIFLIEFFGLNLIKQAGFVLKRKFKIEFLQNKEAFYLPLIFVRGIVKLKVHSLLLFKNFQDAKAKGEGKEDL